MSRKIPRNIIGLLFGWFSTTTAMVRWNACMSSTVKILFGVRQGGVLSPFLFAICVDDVLIKLRDSSLGCRFRGLLINAIMYADDLLLLSLSIRDLQLMVDLCSKEFKAIGLSINFTKSACLRIGPCHNADIASISVNGISLAWKSELRYLGVIFLKAPSVKCNLQNVRHMYFRSLNGIFGKIGAHSPINVTLSLINSFCVPVLTYGIEAFNVSVNMYNVLEAAYSSAFFKIFKTFDKQVVKQCQYYCRCLPLCYVIVKRRISFLLKLQTVSNFYLSVLFKISGKNEVEKLINKHKLNNSCAQIKHKMWTNFANLCL